ncbi:MAG: putative transposase YbfD/YdcC [Bacteroidia bacterium]|jgi:predicted transposase YbfD/YdcC
MGCTIDILLIGILAIISGAETWNNIEEYGEAKEEFLTKFLKLTNGVPSHDTFNRVFASIDPLELEGCFVQWVKGMIKVFKGDIISIDGKTIRRGKSAGNKSPFHIVSAWSSKNNVTLGQVMTQQKSNEITAIPELLELLVLEDTVVTIDAMGCQKEIASCILGKDADYILAVKNNQKHLYEDIQYSLNNEVDMLVDQTIDVGHGRIEKRICSISEDLTNIESREQWEELKTIIKVVSTRTFKNSTKPTETAVRYYISSLRATPSEFHKAIRSHWEIENKLHWTLDVAFGEDASRKRTGYSARNFATLNKIALNLLKNETSLKVGVKGRRLKAGWDDNYLIKVLNL